MYRYSTIQYKPISKLALTFTPPESFPSSQFWVIYALIGGVRVNLNLLTIIFVNGTSRSIRLTIITLLYDM